MSTSHLPLTLLVFIFSIAFPSVHAKDQGQMIPAPIHIDACEAAAGAKYYPRGSIIETPDIADPVSMAKGILHMQAWTYVRTFFSLKWDTQVYFTATGTPDPKTFEIPLVDPDAKGVVLFIHGSGTAKSSGSNFVTNMSALANLGYSTISVDLPFHASGPLQNRLNDSDEFMEWMKKIIEDIKASGKPVYLAGHSFGPDVIFELVSRYPGLVQGATAISPAGFNKILEDWYNKFTSKMKFGGAVAENVTGATWAGTVIKDFGWNKGARPDPTIVNPDLRLRILTSDREEYVPAPVGGPNKTPVGPNTYDIAPVLQGMFAGASVTVEKGIGHYLFDWRDDRDLNAVQREILLMLGEDPTQMKAMATATGAFREKRPFYEKLAHQVLFDLPFRAWYLSEYSERMAQQILTQRNDTLARKVFEEYETKGRFEISAMIAKAITETEVTRPDFFAANKAKIEEANQRGLLDGTLVGPFYRAMNGGYSVSTSE